MQLVAYGMQDVYLTGNSQITFFKNLYRRHTNFSCEAVEQTFQSNSTEWGNKLVAVISRNGDLLHRLWLEVDLQQVDAAAAGHTYVSKLGHALIKSAEVEIGGQRIDKIYGRFTHLYHKLTCEAQKEAGYELMTGNDGLEGTPSSESKAHIYDAALQSNGRYTDASDFDGDANSDNVKEVTLAAGRTQVGFSRTRKLYIPLNFWFSKGSAGAALPLIALQYHEVRVSIEIADMADILRGHIHNDSRENDTDAAKAARSLHGSSKFDASHEQDDGAASKVDLASVRTMANPPRLYADFFYLDTDERRRFSQMSHEYLIEQLQFTGSEVTPDIADSPVPHSIRLNFNHPTKALYWTTEITGKNDGYLNPFYCGWSGTEDDDLKQKLASGQASMLHDNCPIKDVTLQLNGHERFSKRDGSYFSLCQPYQYFKRVPWDHPVGVYSFSLSPEEHQPSGALNFSRIDNASLKLTFKEQKSPKFLESDGTTTSPISRNVYVYAVNYNVLRILSGMGGLAFSN
jgi:hypothetical protein